MGIEQMELDIDELNDIVRYTGITLKEIAKELEIPQFAIYMFLNGWSGLPEADIEKLNRLIKKLTKEKNQELKYGAFYRILGKENYASFVIILESFLKLTEYSERMRNDLILMRKNNLQLRMADVEFLKDHLNTRILESKEALDKLHKELKCHLD